MLRTMDRPTNATLRSCLAAASSPCWTRCTWLAKQATMMRLAAELNTSSSTGAMARSLVVKPGLSALVEADMSRATPSAPSRAEPADVGQPPVQRQLVHLEVAGVQDQPGRRADGHGQGVRDRVVDREELQVKRAELLAGALGHL